MTGASPSDAVPTVGTLHHLACSGGTVIARALAAMRGVVLLSEQHPEQAMGRRTDPIKQAQAAGAPIGDDDVACRFARDIRFVAERCAADGLGLIVRDHANRDYLGTETFQLRCLEVLSGTCVVRPVCTVRHPLDTWLALRAAGWFDGDLDAFLPRFRSFAEVAIRIGFERYEDFVAHPNSTLRRLAGALGVTFDADWRDGFDEVAHMTGASGRSSSAIAPRPRRSSEPEAQRAFHASEAWGSVLDMLGYQRHADGVAA